MDMEKEVLSWGLPDVLQDKKIEHYFYEELTNEKGIKFSLKEDDQEVFIMDFFLPSNTRAFNDEENYLKLNLVHVPDDKLKRQGITSFFLDKFLGFTQRIGREEIHLSLAPKKEEKGMTKEQLREYYKKHLGSDPSIKLKIDEKYM